jgi:hypothetical protein
MYREYPLSRFLRYKIPQDYDRFALPSSVGSVKLSAENYNNGLGVLQIRLLS